MRANDDRLAQARDSIGFFRILLEQEGEVGYSSSNLGAGFVTAECSTRVAGATYIAIAWPAAFAPAPARPEYTNGVEIFIDGTLVQRSSWSRNDDVWSTWCKIDDNLRVTVSIVGHAPTPPPVLRLLRDPQPKPSSRGAR